MADYLLLYHVGDVKSIIDGHIAFMLRVNRTKFLQRVYSNAVLRNYLSIKVTIRVFNEDTAFYSFYLYDLFNSFSLASCLMIEYYDLSIPKAKALKLDL